MSTDDEGTLRGGPDSEGRVEVRYRFPGRRYYLLTTGSGYPSAEFHVPLSPGDKPLVVPEAGKSSANAPPEG